MRVGLDLAALEAELELIPFIGKQHSYDRHTTHTMGRDDFRKRSFVIPKLVGQLELS